MTTAVALDTDIGSDIDDAVALAYLLREPRCDLVAITTVSGDTAKRAAMADIVCRAAGRDDIPIARGAERPLLHGPGQQAVPQYDAVASREHTLERPPSEAVELLRETIRSRPGEITLLTIGPFTNAALLFALDPQIVPLLGGLVSMGGWFTHARPEWNASVDPTATAMTYRAGVRGHVSVGLDVTLRCTMRADEVRERFTSPPLEVVCEAAEVWFGHRPAITFHDPLAAVTIFEPDVCSFDTGRVHVEPNGQTVFTPGDGPHRVATDVDPARFFERYFSVFG